MEGEPNETGDQNRMALGLVFFLKVYDLADEDVPRSM
jgi:hypothetical protein